MDVYALTPWDETGLIVSENKVWH